MTFTITAWGPDGRNVFHINGPVGKTKFVDIDDFSRPPRTHITDDEKSTIIQMVGNGCSDKQIAGVLRCSVRAVSHLARRLGVTDKRNHKSRKFLPATVAANNGGLPETAGRVSARPAFSGDPSEAAE